MEAVYTLRLCLAEVNPAHLGRKLETVFRRFRRCFRGLPLSIMSIFLDGEYISGRREAVVAHGS